MRQKIAHFHFHKIEQFGIVHHVHLFRNTTIEGTPTWRANRYVREFAASAIRCQNDQDRAVHLRRTGNHVLHVVRVTRTIDVSIVSLFVRYSTCAVLIVIPRSFSSGALSIWSYRVASAMPFSAKTVVIAAVKVVFPWST